LSLNFTRSAGFGALLCYFSTVLSPALASAGMHRSYAAKREFQPEHPCLSTGRTSGACPGYVQNHIVPLAYGGPDTVANLQWHPAAICSILCVVAQSWGPRR
jgi:hypothetical protein